MSDKPSDEQTASAGEPTGAASDPVSEGSEPAGAASEPVSEGSEPVSEGSGPAGERSDAESTGAGALEPAPAETPPELIPAVPVTIAAPAAAPAAATAAGFGPPAGHRPQFFLIYALLGAALVAALAGLIVLVIAPRVGGSAAPWSSWKPSGGSTTAIENSIASHVGGLYRLSKNGKPLVAVIAEAPVVTSGTTKVDVSEVAIAQKGSSSSSSSSSSNGGYAIFPSSNTWTDELCGLGPSCAISSGQPTNQRGQLVRREALELALYTFKFSQISSLITYMPPPMGQPAGEVLYFQKSNYGKQLSQPLSKTLSDNTPLPTQTDTTEKATINKLTLPSLYSYSLAALQDGSAALVLSPVLGG